MFFSTIHRLVFNKLYSLIYKSLILINKKVKKSVVRNLSKILMKYNSNNINASNILKIQINKNSKVLS